MALIVEDGTGLDPVANSYQSVGDLRNYAELRGVDLTNKSNQDLETVMIKAMDFLENQRGKYKGQKVSASQPLEWPRSDVYDVDLPGELHPFNQIPRLLKYAQLALALEALDHDLQPNRNLTGQGSITKEKVGDIEVTYSVDKPAQNFTSAFTKPAGMLSPLFKRSGLSLVKV